MNKVRLGDVCEAIIDCPHTTPKWRSGGIPVIRNFNLENTVISLRDPSFVDEETYKSRTRRAMPEEGDIVISREAPMGKVGLVPKDLKCCLGQRLVLLKPKHDAITSRYLLIALASNFVQTQIRRADTAGSIVSNLTLPQIRDLIIPISDVADAIASLLGAIDDKIALNKKLCAELEETAQLIYDYWFTQFDFPDENGNPYRSSGGKMVYNETLKREIPEGWEVVTLGSRCATLLGGTPDTTVSEYWNGDIPWLSSAEAAQNPILVSEKTITQAGLSNSATSFAPKGSVILSITRYIRPSILAIDASFNQSVVAILESELLHTQYLYPLIKQQVPRYLSLRTGAQQPHINKETIDRTLIVVPPMSVLEKYYSMSSGLYEELIQAAKEAASLTALRDWLLPMLMNGQVKPSIIEGGEGTHA